jgi:hypothetical protein
MSDIKFSGISPDKFWFQDLSRIINKANKATLDFEKSLIEATPSGVGGALRQSWRTKFATFDKPEIKISNNKKYLLPVELGRKPGKGVSPEGQRSVALWAKRKGVLKGKQKDSNLPVEEQRKQFAFALSLKYLREGRPAVGFIGLAKPGSKAPSSLANNLKPVSDSLLANYFKDIENAFD